MMSLLAVATMTAGCNKKKDDAKTDKAGDMAKPAEAPKPAGTTATAPAPTPTPTPAAAGEMSAADYEAKDVAMMDKAIATFGAADADCDKAAATAGKFFDDNKADTDALEAFEKAHPDVKKQVEEKNKD